MEFGPDKILVVDTDANLREHGRVAQPFFGDHAFGSWLRYQNVGAALFAVFEGCAETISALS